MRGALRVVLGVTEVSEIQALRKKLTEMEAAQPRLMEAYHFQESMRRFAKKCIDDANEDLEEGEPRHTCVNISIGLLPLDAPTARQIEEMLFIRPDDVEPIQDESIESLAKFFADKPQNFEAYMQICCEDSSNLIFTLDTPDEGMLLVCRKDD